MLDQANVEDFMERILHDWILSNDDMQGNLWDDLCLHLGLDPDTLAIAAVQARARHPRLKCGHYETDWNTYIRYGKLQCRICAGLGSTETSTANRVDPKELA